MRQKNVQPTDHPVIIIIIIITPMICFSVFFFVCFFVHEKTTNIFFFLKGYLLKIDVALRDMLDSEQSF